MFHAEEGPFDSLRDRGPFESLRDRRKRKNKIKIEI
jgi:hypothetical protein